MQEIIAYKCIVCGELHENKGVCECVIRDTCTHSKIESKYLYTNNDEDEICLSCHRKGGYKLREERMERLKNNGGIEVDYRENKLNQV